jgi:hypothetical protein
LAHLFFAIGALGSLVCLYSEQIERIPSSLTADFSLGCRKNEPSSSRRQKKGKKPNREPASNSGKERKREQSSLEAVSFSFFIFLWQ